MIRFSTSPLSLLKTLFINKDLIVMLVFREVVGRYKGSVAGVVWAFITPVITLLMYTLVFGVILKSRWGLNSENTSDYALILFAGLIFYNLISECLAKAPALIIGNVSFVKQVIFPLEILPVTVLGSAVFHFLVSFGLLISVWACLHELSILYIIVTMLFLLPLCLISLGLVWFLAASTVYFRDIGQVVTFLNGALLFLSPIFYQSSVVPEGLKSFLYFNPLTLVIDTLRDMLIFGVFPTWQIFSVYFVVSLFIAYAGYAYFQKIRSGFADVI